ncbi:MAG: carbohydrate-binding protein, partial [Verrucomicrobiota bacterium]|nr:carbohydrate-binding protein [Verrucomicrobiota bacterium]
MMISKLIPICCCLLLTLSFTRAAELHVAVTGDDANSGNPSAPLRTIQRAAELAQPGDRITVHEGVYRERVNPPRGGTSEDQRITFQAAPGEKVIVKGSEVVKGWQHTEHNVWRVQLPNSMFGAFNPFSDSIRGDWFNGRGRLHHTGAVYLNGTWLTEATSLDEVRMPPGTRPAWLSNPTPEYIINVAWLAVGDAAHLPIRIPAAEFSSQHGIQTAACSEGGECIGWIEHGDWTRYAAVDFGAGADRFEFRAAAPGQGGLIEVRLDGPEGQLLGVCRVRNTGDWQTWASFTTQLEQPIKGVQDLCLVFKALDAGGGPQNAINPNLWFAQVDDTYTTLWAQFPEADPNQELVEVNVRQSVFYPDRPGRDFITVRGFTLQHAATPWAPPTAEQIGLIGTHWSLGWIIENNTITHSVCTGITLGKHGDQYDNTSADTAEGYVKTIERAHAFPIPWTRDHVGGHLVRNNLIAYCEQAGIVGSM